MGLTEKILKQCPPIINVNSLFWISSCRHLDQSKKDEYRCEINIDPVYVGLFNRRGERNDDGCLENLRHLTEFVAIIQASQPNHTKMLDILHVITSMYDFGVFPFDLFPLLYNT